MWNPTGGVIMLKQVPPGQAQETLNIWQALEGNEEEQIHQLKEKNQCLE